MNLRIIVPGVIAQGLISIGCVYYVVKKLDISEHVKRILISEGLFMLALSTLSGIGVGITMMETSNDAGCKLRIEPVVLSFLTIAFHMMLLSNVKYDIAKKAGQNKAIDDFKIKEYTFKNIKCLFALIAWSLTMSLGFDDNISQD